MAAESASATAATAHDVSKPVANGDVDDVPVSSAAEGEAQVEQDGELDDDLLPFELALHFPARPLLPSDATDLGLPATPSPLRLAVQPTELLNDIRMTLADSPEGYWLGSYCFRRPAPGATPADSSKSVNGNHGAKGKSNLAPVEAKGEIAGEWIELKDIFKDVPKDQRELYITHTPLNEADARGHIQRLRDLLAGAHNDPTTAALDAGISVHDAVRHPDLWTKEVVGYAAAQAAANNKAKGSKEPAIDLAAEAAKPLFREWSGWPEKSATQLLPPQARPPRVFPTCLRSLAVSAWSPPPQHLRARGHLFYLQVATLEGETIVITVSTSGFSINKSTTAKFDPTLRPAGENFAASSLFDLLCGYSRQFVVNFAKIFNDPLSARDFFAVLPLTNCIPAHPWMARTLNHTADSLRPQTAFLLTGTTSVDSLEGARDWNEEIQSARELPRASLPERHVRERALGRLFSDFAKAAASAVPKVAAGEYQALNPMDKREAQMYCVNNLFISRGVDGVDIYPYLGGDEAAHVAVSKDVQGIRILNSLDIDGLCLLGTVIVDWHGERYVAQSIIPGLFRKREELDDSLPEGETTEGTTEAGTPATKSSDTAEDTQVLYGGLEGPEIIRTNASFHKLFEEVAKHLHLSKHAIEDAKGKTHDLWLSVDSKGLRGADGRKYALDVARLMPVDVEFIEKEFEGQALEAVSSNSSQAKYPHEMVLLRPELLELYWDSEFRKWAREQLAKKGEAAEKRKAAKAVESGESAESAETEKTADAAPAEEQETIDASAFQLTFNPDAFVKFKPPTGDDKAATPSVKDESDPTVAAVRAASRYLREVAVPQMVTESAVGVALAADGAALSRQMHVKGINMRYLGLVAHLAAPEQHAKLDQDSLARVGPGYEANLHALRGVAIKEMVLRASKRLFNASLRSADTADKTACVSHFLNCLLGASRDASPAAEWFPSPFLDASHVPSWTELTPATLSKQLQHEVRMRFRFELPDDFLDSQIRKPQLLREICLRLGIQLKLQEYVFDGHVGVNGSANLNGHASGASDGDAPHTDGAAEVKASKKKKSTGAKKLAKEAQVKAARSTTFVPDDILNLVPVVKDSASSSKVAEDAFETGRITMMARGERELGVELLLEGISFHETIYGMSHPETARCYALYASIAHQFAGLIGAETQARIREEQEKQGKEDVQVEVPAYTEHLSSATALRYQRQAVTISERTLGLDHSETLSQWASLAVLERAEGNYEESLRCQARVIELQNIIYGQRHPDMVSAMTMLGTTLQSARQFEASLQVFRSAHELAIELFGVDSLNAGNLAFELCQAQSLVGDLRTALETLKEAVRIFELRLGKEHSHTKEASIFLSSLAAAAVRAAKVEQSQKIREATAARSSVSNLLRSSAATNGVSSSAATASKSSAANGARRPAVDPQLSVDELVQYISGNGTASRPGGRKGKSKARNPQNSR